MPRLNRSTQEHLYTETEAAGSLGITVARLHQLLDQHIFTDGNHRPAALHFTSGDLLLLGYWCPSRKAGPGEVVTMPKRP